MNLRICKWLGVAMVAMSAVLSAAADPLQFTNVTTKLFPTLAEQLNAVTYGGTSNFLAVGNHEVYVIGNFTPQQSWFTTASWVTNDITSNKSRTGSNLTAVASSGKLFVASGDNNWIYVATNNFTPAGLIWPSNNSKAFGNGVLASAAAFNNTNFIVAGEAPDIGFTNSPLGTNFWPLGTLVTPDFAESFRGVTAYGTNGFIVCGVFGDVRLSTNGGASWVSLFGKVGQPDFLGVASDGGKTFVCVGGTNATASDNGIILTSTNGGLAGSWRTTFSNDLSVAKSQLNAVAYTGSGFVAVGNNGQVLSSTNGINWNVTAPTNIAVANASSATNVNFMGVSFATSGFMHDVGEIVGASGNVIVTAPPPPTNNSYGNEWISVGVTTPVSVGVTNTLPANTLQVTNIWGTNIVTVDWYTGPWPNNTLAVDYQGNPATNSYTFTPPFITDNSDNHTNTYWAQARDLRTGFVNTNRTVMVLTNFMRPTSTMTDTNVICNGDTTTIHVQLTGNAPWTVYWTDGFTNFTNSVGSSGVFYSSVPFVTSLTLPNSAFNPTNVFLNQATNHDYQVWKLSDAFFPNDDPKNLNPTGANPSGDLNGVDVVTVNPRPTVAVVTTNTICNGSEAILQANLTGIGPWTVYWTDGFTNFTQTVNVSGGGPFTDFLTIPNGTFNPTNVFPNAPSNHTYSVYAISDSNCSGNANDISGVGSITVNPRPTASLMTAQTICNGQFGLVQLQANLTGIGPWTVTWSDGFVQTTNAPAGSGATVVRGVSALEVTNVFFNNPTNYIFTVAGVSNADTCLGNEPGDLSCTNVVTVNPRPTASQGITQTICNGQSDEVQLQASLTGLGPWTVTWSDGFVQTTNAPIGSGAVVVRGVQPLEVTNVFLNNATNYIFTVSSVTNADTCSGNQPGDLTCTNSINVNPRPTASQGITQTICNGQSGLLQLQASLTGLGPWTVTWSDGFTQTTNAPVGSGAVVVRGVPALEATNVFLNNPTNYTFTVLSVTNADTCAGNQPGDLTATNTVTVNPRPTASLGATETICDGQSSLVQLQASLTGLGPWTVVWSDGVVQTTNAPVGSGAVVVRGVQPVQVANLFPNNPTNYLFTVVGLTNADTCDSQPGDLLCTNTITVNPRPMASLVTSQTICNGDTAVLQASLTGLGPWTVTWSDGVVQTTNAPVGSGVLLVRAVSSVEATNVFLNAPTNYVFTVLSISNADTCASQPGDLTTTNTITINPRPTASQGIAQTICDGQSGLVQLQASLTGVGPWTVTWSDGFVQTTNAPAGSGAVVVRGVTAPEVADLFPNNLTNYFFTVASVTNADGCAANPFGDLTATNEVTVNPIPTASLVSTQSICNGDSPVLKANLTGLGPWVVTWSDGFSQTTNAPAGSGVTVVRTAPSTEAVNLFPNNSTNFIFTVTSVSNADSCASTLPQQLTSTNFVIVNPRPTAAVVTTNTVCNGTPAVLQVNLTGIGPWTLFWTNSFTNVTQTVNHPGAGPFSTTFSPTGGFYPTNQLANAATNYVYSIYAVSDTNCSANSGDISGMGVVTVDPLPTSTLLPFATTNCNDGTTFTLTNVLTGIGPWTVTWSLDGQSSPTTVGTGAGPFTNVITVSPTNSLAATGSSNNVYFVASVTGTNSCANGAGQLVGTNRIAILPTASVPANGFSISSDDLVAHGVDKGTVGSNNHISGITSNNYVFNLNVTQFGILNKGTNNILFITDHLNFTGPGPWTVVLQQVSADFAQTVMTTNYYTNTFRVNQANNATVVITNVITQGVSGTNFTISVYSVTSTNTACSSVLATNAYVIYVDATPQPIVSIAGSGGVTQTNICGLPLGQPTNITVQVAVQGGVGPWSITWADGTNQTSTDANIPINRTFSVMDLSSSAPSTYTFAVTNLDVTNALNHQFTVGIYDTNAANVQVTVDPTLSTPPVNSGDVTSCYDVAAPLSVSVPAGYTVDWFNGATQVATNTTTFVPPAPVSAGATAPVTNIYTALAYFVDTNLTGPCYSPGTNVLSISVPCTNTISSITVSGTNVLVSWFGNYQLQTTTNLAPPVIWTTNVYTGQVITNTWTNAVSPSAEEFFRLYAPTN